jgi:hypothetical protein
VRDDDRFYPGWFCECIGQAMVLAEWVRQWLGRPDVEYILQADFRVLGSPGILTKDDTFDSLKSIHWKARTIGPYQIGNRASIPNLFSVIERDVWDLFGNEVCEVCIPLTIDWDAVFADVKL